MSDLTELENGQLVGVSITKTAEQHATVKTILLLVIYITHFILLIRTLIYQ